MIGSMGKEFAFGYEEAPGRGMSELTEKAMGASKKGSTRWSPRGKKEYELVVNAFIGRRGTERMTERQSRGHTVKYSPFFVRVREREKRPFT